MARKLVEVLLNDGSSSYHVTIPEAQQLTQSNQAKWQGPRKIIRSKDMSKRDIWEPKQSGYAGPLVLQLT